MTYSTIGLRLVVVGAALLAALGALLYWQRKRGARLGEQADAARRAADRASRLLYTDALTGLANVRAFLNIYAGVFSPAALRTAPVMLAALSCEGHDNSLKYVNDHYGYDCGDRCILDFAQAIQAAFPAPGYEIYYLGASNFYVLCRQRRTQEEIFERYKALKALWHDVPYAVGGTEAVIGHMVLQFAAVMLPDAGQDVDDLQSMLFHLIAKDETASSDGCVYYISTERGQRRTNIAMDDAASGGDRAYA